MRILTFALIAAILGLQYPLWLGKGSWFKVWEHEKQLKYLKQEIQKQEIRNAGLDAEVADLQHGYQAIEERARFELGMIKANEVFVQLPEKPRTQVIP